MLFETEVLLPNTVLGMSKVLPGCCSWWRRRDALLPAAAEKVTMLFETEVPLPNTFLGMSKVLPDCCNLWRHRDALLPAAVA